MTLREHIAGMVKVVNALFAERPRQSAMRDRFRAVTACAAEATVSGSEISMSAALARLHRLEEALRQDRYVYRGKSR